MTIFILPATLTGQGKLEGKIFDNIDPDQVGLPGASIFWAGTTKGTSANNAGYFMLKRTRETNKLVVSFIGYKTDTIEVDRNESYLLHGLSISNELTEIVIYGKATGTHLDMMNPILTVNITGAELRKAACCNLSESFETNASVNVNYTDAATGARQIQLLGLAGNYTQILVENIPSLSGLATAYGLNYIPGPWMESIQVSKGTSSVRNGYESIAGQINIEFKKPVESEKLYLNAFISDAGRQELNAHTSVVLNDNWSTMLLAHGELQKQTSDHNADNFRDEPDVKQYHLFNRWDYLTDNGDFRTGFRYLEEERIGGQFSYKPGDHDTWSNGFGINIKTRRLDGFTKLGKVFMKDRSMSVGWIQNLVYHSQDSYFGYQKYEGIEKTYYTSLLYQWTPLLSKHTIDAGFSYKADWLDEQINDTKSTRTESVPGVFVQYTFSDTAKITLVAGIRTDFHNIWGTLVTPRVHLRYATSPNITMRASAGKGFRSVSVVAENSYLLASSREMIIDDNLKVEEANNYGFSISAKTQVSGKDIMFTAEVYHTNFINQVVIDLDTDVHEVRYYNLEGKSYSNVLQLEMSFEPIKGLDLLAAWRWNDVKTTYNSILRSKPLTGKYKGLLTLSYLTNLNKWQFDYTLQLNGPGRIPSTAANPPEYQRDDSFEAFPVMNLQITRYFRRMQLYLGSENLLGFRQDMPIIASDDPFGNYFDTGLVWGPIHGRKIYAGLRFIIKRDMEK